MNSTLFMGYDLAQALVAAFIVALLILIGLAMQKIEHLQAEVKNLKAAKEAEDKKRKEEADIAKAMQLALLEAKDTPVPAGPDDEVEAAVNKVNGFLAAHTHRSIAIRDREDSEVTAYGRFLYFRVVQPYSSGILIIRGTTTNQEHIEFAYPVGTKGVTLFSTEYADISVSAYGSVSDGFSDLGPEYANVMTRGQAHDVVAKHSPNIRNIQAQNGLHVMNRAYTVENPAPKFPMELDADVSTVTLANGDKIRLIALPGKHLVHISVIYHNE